MTISLMTENHIEDLLSIESASFKCPWGKLSFVNELARAFSYNFVLTKKIKSHDQIVAYICMREIIDEIHILKLAVKSSCRNKGIAYQFLSDCIQSVVKNHIRGAFLETRPSNIAGLSLYRKLGFHIIGKRPKYYLDPGEDAIVMRKLF